MCYRFADNDTEEYVEWYVREHGIKKYYWRGNYYENGFSHGKSLVHAQGKMELEEMEWGLIPFWVKTEAQAKEIRTGTLNAMSETVFSKPSYRGSIKTKKCLIFARNFYEHRHVTEKNKIPYLIGVRNGNAPDQFKPFTFGGLYDTWTDTSSGEIKESYSIITTEANSMMQIIHNSKKRMPLIIDEEDQFAWLEATDEKTIKELMVPFPAEKMKAYPIHKKFSDPRVFADVRQALLPQEYAEVDVKEFM